MRNVPSIIAALTVLVGPTAALAAEAPRAERVATDSINDTARFLAGLRPSGGAAARLADSPEWQRHAAYMDAEWAKFEAGRMSRVRAWAGTALDVRGAVFYPFSGPDFVYAYNFFPKAGTYILAALEPVGSLPPVENIGLGALGGVEASLHTLLYAGYFVTKDMRANLRGTLPIFCILLARSGCTIYDVKTISGGVQIQFGSGWGGRRTLFYLSCDLSNGGFRSNRGLQNLIRDAGARTAFLKADSYLMHSGDFSAIRETLLNQFRVIVQDDSGIPIRYFDPAKWSVRLYGSYVPPLDIFRQYYQADLAEAYRGGNPRPIQFGLGYHWNPKEANVIVASRK